MEIKKLIKKALTSACIYFTVITALYMLILQIANIDSGAAAVEAHRVLLFFIASVLFAIAGMIMGMQNIHMALRYIIHYAISVLTFYFCFLLPINMSEASFAFTGVVIFTLIYVVAAAAIGIFKSRLRANREKSEAYNSQFKNNQSKKK